MKSMTGYGRAEITLPGFHGVIELSSVNKKGFDYKNLFKKYKKIDNILPSEAKY